MRSRSLARFPARLRWVALVAAAATLGCDDGGSPGARSRLEGQTVRVEDGTGYGPVTLALLDPERLSLQAVVESDADGEFLFVDVPAGRYVPVVYDETRVLYHAATPTVQVTSGRSARVVLPMIAVTPTADLQLHGRVVDAVTGKPIVGAMADLGSLGPRSHTSRREFSELDGWTGSLNQVTDATGRFRLTPVYFLAGPGTSPATPELLITAPGYLAYRRQGFESEAELSDTVRVAMQPGRDDGIVTGRLIGLDGQPVAGLRVGLEWTRVTLGAGKLGTELPLSPPTLQPNVIVQQAVGLSDADGRFRIDGAPTGFFLVIAAYPRDDGWAGQYGPNADLTAADSTDAGDIIVVPTVLTTYPADLDTVLANEAAFSWIPVSGASSYQVTLYKPDGRVAVSLPDPDPFIDPPDSSFAQPGLYLWNVQAFADIGEISRTDRARSFVVAAPAGAGALTKR